MLAIGALLDLDAPPHSYDANHYYQLGRAALSVDSMFEEQSIPAIQALACDLVWLGSKALTARTAPYVPLHVPFRYRWSSVGAYGPRREVGAQCKHPPSSRDSFTFVDCFRFSAVFVRYLAWSSHTTESADCISQTETAVGGVWTLQKRFDDGHFSGRYTPMTRGRYGTPQD